MDKREWCLYLGQGVLYLAVLTWVFYRSAAIFFILLPTAFLCPLCARGELKKKRLERLRLQFRDAILSVSSGLDAGYSAENAFFEAQKEMARMHGSDSMICGELGLILSRVHLNRTFEEALSDFADRSGLEDVRSFAEVFLAARKSGGELMKIISRTAGVISEKIRIEEDIRTATASRRMEQKLMCAMPVLIVFYIDLSSPGFFSVLYTTMLGRLIMTVCLLLYLASCALSRYFQEIAV